LENAEENAAKAVAKPEKGKITHRGGKTPERRQSLQNVQFVA